MSVFQRQCDRLTLRSGLTLLELLVVLTILAVLATVAVNTLGPRVETERYQATARQLDHIREAVLGKPDLAQADGTPILSGFVEDVGRRPLWLGNAGAASSVESLLGNRINPPKKDALTGRELAELWQMECPLAQSYPFGFRTGPKQPIDFSDVRLPCGWRGPYLHLPVGSDRLVDSWGRPFTAEIDAAGMVTALECRPPTGPGEPLTVRLEPAEVSVSGVLQTDGKPVGTAPTVHLLVPDPQRSVTELVVLEDEDDDPNSFLFSRVPIGVRVVCVSVGGRRVITRYVHVPHQGLSLVLELPGDIEGNP